MPGGGTANRVGAPPGGAAFLQGGVLQPPPFSGRVSAQPPGPAASAQPGAAAYGSPAELQPPPRSSLAALGLAGGGAGGVPRAPAAAPGVPPAARTLSGYGVGPQPQRPPSTAGTDLLALITKGGGGAGLGGQPAGLFGSYEGADGEGAARPFDPSDFPTLGGGQGSGSGGLLAPGGEGDHVGPGGDFSMATEDFPALPGAPGGAKGDGGAGRDILSLLHAGGGGSETGEGHSARPPDGSGGYSHRGEPPPPPSLLSPPPRPGSGGGGASSVDRFGLLGLLGAIRMRDVDLSTLALGTDLTGLGLALNSSEPLYRSFASPWADAPCRPEADPGAPACYLQQPPWLGAALLARFSPESLFYVFYSSPGDEAQLGAAEELAARGWYWHKELKAWLQRAPDAPPPQKAERGERGSYVFFDASQWELVRKDAFVLSYSELDETPRPRPPVQQPTTI